MGELDPRWVWQREQDIEKGDLELAVRMICREDRVAYVVNWLNILHKGLKCGLKELIWNYGRLPGSDTTNLRGGAQFPDWDY